MGTGEVEARDRLLTVVLRRRAAAYVRRERVEHTLQPRVLVHEAYLRLVKQDRAAWQNRAQFFGVAAQMMRRILVERARARKMAKRPGRWARVTLDEAVAQRPALKVDVLDLDRALNELATFDARKAESPNCAFSAARRSKRPGTCLTVSGRDGRSGSGRQPARGDKHHPQVLGAIKEVLARNELYGFGVEA